MKKEALPKIVSRPAWEKACKAVLAREKKLIKAMDAVAAERRRLPMVPVEKQYTFTASSGKKSLLDLFEGRDQLIVYHFMYAPDTCGWPDAGCPGCSMFVDNIGHLAHLHARRTSFTLVSLAPLARLLRYRKRMGWNVPWVSSAGSSFNLDFGATTHEGEGPGISVFLRDGKKVYQTYAPQDRTVQNTGSVWSLLDLTPLGRQETWEKTPARRPQSEAYKWWERHDEY